MFPAFWHPPFLPAGDSHPGSPYLPRDPVHIRRLGLLAPPRKVCLVGLMLGLPVSSSERTCPYWCYSTTHSWGPHAPLGRAALAAESMLLTPCNWLENPPKELESIFPSFTEILKVYLLMTALGLHCRARVFSGCGVQSHCGGPSHCGAQL